MKTKRNKRVLKARAMRASYYRPDESAVSRYLATLSERVFPARNRLLIRRKSKAVVGLLEQDAAIQAERLRVFEESIFEVLNGPEPVLVPVRESSGRQPAEQTAATRADGRTDYEYVLPSKRVRRRII